MPSLTRESTEFLQRQEKGLPARKEIFDKRTTPGQQMEGP